MQVSGRVGDGTSFGSVFQALWREEGVRGLYKGVSARMFYMGCNSFFLIGAYEVGCLHESILVVPQPPLRRLSNV